MLDPREAIIDTSQFWTVATILFYLAGVLTVGHVLLNGRNRQCKLAWCVFLFAMPIFALPISWLVGRSRLGGYIARRHELDKDTVGKLEEAREKLEPYRCHKSPFSYAECLTSLVPTRGNTLKLFTEGEEAFEAIIEAVDQAQDYVLSQFYVIRDDWAGTVFLQRLRNAVKRGVRVHLYIDPLESQLSESELRALEEAGIGVAIHAPAKSVLDLFQDNFRNHRKLVVVDGKLALLGGMNVGDNYLSREEGTSPWNDLFLRLQGPAVLNAQLGFFRDYYCFTGDRLELSWEVSVCDEAEATVAVFPTDPGDLWDACGLTFVEAINQAQERIVLASPYFIPDEKALAALQNASLRGVRVIVLRPHETLVKTADLAAWHYIELLLPHGVEFYRQPEGVMHKKVLLVDDKLSLIGSANFDYRSFHLNHELFLWIDSEPVNRRLASELNNDLERFRRLTEEDLESRSLIERLLTEATSLMVPLL